MSIHPRTNASGRTWQVKWREGGRQHSRTFRDARSAQRFERENTDRLEMGAHGPALPSRDLLDDWLDEWWQRHSPGWEHSTRTTRKPVMDKWIRPYLGKTSLFHLGTSEVMDWRAAIVADDAKPRASATTANNAMRILSAALGAAVTERRLPINPCAPIRRLPTMRKVVRPLTPVQVERIRQALPTERDRLFWSLMALAGLRTEEALALRWSDVDDRQLVISRAVVDGIEKGTKTGRIRTIPLVGPLRDDLAALRPESDPAAIVCPGTQGQWLDLHNWRSRVFDPATIAAGVNPEPPVATDGKRERVTKVATPYSGRHHYASLLIHAGYAVTMVAAYLGHSTGETTLKHYAHMFSAADLGVRMDPEQATIEAREQVAREAAEADGCSPDVPGVFPSAQRSHLRLVA